MASLPPTTPGPGTPPTPTPPDPTPPPAPLPPGPRPRGPLFRAPPPPAPAPVAPAYDPSGYRPSVLSQQPRTPMTSNQRFMLGAGFLVLVGVAMFVFGARNNNPAPDPNAAAAALNANQLNNQAAAARAVETQKCTIPGTTYVEALNGCVKHITDVPTLEKLQPTIAANDPNCKNKRPGEMYDAALPGNGVMHRACGGRP